MADTKKIKLAHPLTAAQAERLHAKDVKDYAAGEEGVFPIADVRTLVDAGYVAGVDPNDADAVLGALGKDVAAAPASAVADTAPATPTTATTSKGK